MRTRKIPEGRNHLISPKFRLFCSTLGWRAFCSNRKKLGHMFETPCFIQCYHFFVFILYINYITCNIFPVPPDTEMLLAWNDDLLTFFFSKVWYFLSDMFLMVLTNFFAHATSLWVSEIETSLFSPDLFRRLFL